MNGESNTTPLSKRKWTQLLSCSLDESPSLAPTPLCDPFAAAMFYRRHSGLVVQFAVEVSRRFPGHFTGSFYLSYTFSWPLTGGDAPDEGYRRIGHFLTDVEQAQFGVSEILGGAWWDGFTENHVQQFARAIKHTCPRFLGQPQLVANVMNSELLRERRDLVLKVRSAAKSGVGADPPPGTRIHKGVGIEWYRAATGILERYAPVRVHKDGVKSYAEDAWSCEKVGLEME